MHFVGSYYMGIFHVKMFIMFSLSCFLRFNIAKYVIVYFRCFTSLCLFFVFSEVTGYVRKQFDRVFEGGEPNCLFFIVCWYSAPADSTKTAIFYNFTPVIGIFLPLERRRGCVEFDIVCCRIWC